MRARLLMSTRFLFTVLSTVDRVPGPVWPILLVTMTPVNNGFGRKLNELAVREHMSILARLSGSRRFFVISATIVSLTILWEYDSILVSVLTTLLTIVVDTVGALTVTLLLALLPSLTFAVCTILAGFVDSFC